MCVDDSPPILKALLTLLLWSCLLPGFLPPSPSTAATLPTGFFEQVVFSGHHEPTAVRFAADGRVFIAEKSGLLWTYDDLEDSSPALVIDLRVQVHNFWDRGFLGLAVDPAFPARPRIYVLYTHDAFPNGSGPRWGKGEPGLSTNDSCPSPPGATEDGCVVFGRLSRIEIDPLTLTGTEKPLLSGNWCQQYPGHSVGDLAFGEDGYLYASAGDGAGFTFADWGQRGKPVNPCGDPPDGVGGPNQGPSAEGGSFRSLDLLTPADPTSFSGAILRIDVSGDSPQAPPDNPLRLLNEKAEDDLVIAAGLRNPFRIAHRPGTDELWIADVGARAWEELNRLADPKGAVEIFGWPCYEGGHARSIPHPSFRDQDLCQRLYLEEIPPGFSSQHAFFAYRHRSQVAEGDLCGTGSASISGLAWNSGTTYPADYRGALFFADSSRQCIWTMFPDAEGMPDRTHVRPFVSNTSGRPVDLKMGPDGNLYYVDFDGGQIFRIELSPDNQPPAAVIEANATSGLVPLRVEFDSSGSRDTEDGADLSRAWDLDGDGQFDDSKEVAPTITYTEPGRTTVRLRVADSAGAVEFAAVDITTGNQPPEVALLSPSSELLWSVGQVLDFAGAATDPQEGPLPAAQLAWELILHHCSTLEDCHQHGITGFEGIAGGSFEAPDHEYPSFLEIRLTATDNPEDAELMLSSTASVLLEPKTVTMIFDSEPQGLSLSVGSLTGTTPFAQTLIVGSQTTVAAASPQVSGRLFRAFHRWSDDGAQTHTVTVPAEDAVLTAHFRPLTDRPVPREEFSRSPAQPGFDPPSESPGGPDISISGDAGQQIPDVETCPQQER